MQTVPQLELINEIFFRCRVSILGRNNEYVMSVLLSVSNGVYILLPRIMFLYGFMNAVDCFFFPHMVNTFFFGSIRSTLEMGGGSDWQRSDDFTVSLL